MQIAITCRHGNLRDGQQEYINEKSQKLLTYFDRVTAIGVMVDFEDDRVKVEINVDAEHKHDFVAHVVGDEVQPTFDAAFQKMEKQIRRYKDKVTDHRHDRPLNEVVTEELAVEPEVESDEA